MDWFRRGLPRRRNASLFTKNLLGLCAVCSVALVQANSTAVAGQSQSTGKVAAEGDSQKHVKTFAPGVRIDWRDRSVEVDAVVVLREGSLELLACSPHTREHESILSIQARPMHLFQAMGLIGLESGSPARYDEKAERWLPPHGEELDLTVRYRNEGGERVEPARQWLLDVKRNHPPDSVKWVFAGSRTFENGRFGADVDGTVVCVVDFDTALITVNALHSADNELLWLVANTKAIPPRGTPCTLVIRSARGPAVVVDLMDDGALRRDGKRLSTAQIADSVRKGMRLVLHHSASATAKTVESAVESLQKAGIDRAVMDLRPKKAAPQPTDPQSPPPGG